MITSKLMGGLGNMLFQISAGYALAKQNNFEYLINASVGGLIVVVTIVFFIL
jgi:hypothetical protein